MRAAAVLLGLVVLVAASDVGAQDRQGAPTASGPALVIRGAAVRVVVTPENRSDIVATTSGGASMLPRVQLRREGATLVIDGGLGDRVRDCGAFVIMGSIPRDWADPVRPDRHGRVNVEGIGRVRLPELPFVDVRVPMDVRIEADGAVYGSVGRSRSVSLSYSGCGKWTVGNTEGDLTLNLTGSGDVNAGSAGRAQARVRGSGDVRLVSAARGLTAEIVGSGDVRVQRADGPMSLRVNGSGDVRVSDGTATNLTAEARGSSDIRVAAADGALRLSTAGSGDVRVGAGRATELSAQTRGSGGVTFDGEAHREHRRLGRRAPGPGDGSGAALGEGVRRPGGRRPHADRLIRGSIA